MVWETKTPDAKNIGAMWHVFDRKDSDKIRFFLNNFEKDGYGHIESRADCDPIHDQNHYMEDWMRRRLFDEEGVICRAFTQHAGEAVVIPAGWAAHTR